MAFVIEIKRPENIRDVTFRDGANMAKLGDAVVVSVKSKSIYCYLPGAAYDEVDGNRLLAHIEVTVGGKGKKEQTARASSTFEYERKMVVGKLCGKNAETFDQVIWNAGSFDECTGFKNDGVMQFSPYNHDQLFIVYDQDL